MAAKTEILTMLIEHDGRFVSGQQLSETLGISRTAIWKHIGELREAGYDIASVKRKGYKLQGRPDTLSTVAVQAGLKTKTFGKTVHFYDQVASTQEIAHKYAREGEPEGTLIVSDEQTVGRGRLGRPWHSPKRSGIWMSLILRPPIPPQQAPQLTLLAAVGIVKGLYKAADLQCEIKWPNDILVEGKKLVGILTELQADPDRVHSVIVGIGMNVNTEREQFPGELREIATSIRAETGKVVDRAALLQQILFETERLYEAYLQEGFHLVKLLWESHSATLGRSIHARTLRGTIEGEAVGLSDSGFLMLRDADGTVHEISSADIDLPSAK
ncbi:MAG TPA: biotin--[acetyl-CoA-carboxylase] ligase [Bacillales bacterium]|nr:biotin--[acetyl-CoA-carboxylase] ligase [Bacillales bacterium]